jgi:GNAT superfamily N-acetyltransferase
VGAIVLRERRDGDADAIARLTVELGLYYARLAPDLFAPVDEASLARWSAADAEWQAQPTTLALVAEVGGEVAGYLEAAIQEPDDAAGLATNRDLRTRHLYINYVATAEAHKRQGVATRLVEAAEDWARGEGVTLALTDTYIDSPQSVPFWEQRMGYKRRAIRLRKRLDE